MDAAEACAFRQICAFRQGALSVHGESSDLGNAEGRRAKRDALA